MTTARVGTIRSSAGLQTTLLDHVHSNLKFKFDDMFFFALYFIIYKAPLDSESVHRSMDIQPRGGGGGGYSFNFTTGVSR